MATKIQYLIIFTILFCISGQSQNNPVLIEVNEGLVVVDFKIRDEAGIGDEAGLSTHLGVDPDTIPIAEGKPKFLGSIYSQSQKIGFTNYWNQVTPENAGKWGSVESTRDNMNWAELDSAYALAKDNGFPYRHHVLVWGNQQPSWIENLPVDEQREEIEEWFQAVANRYPDIDFVEVVNEALHDPPDSPGSGGGNYIEALGGSGFTGWDWVIEAFTLARQYFPDSKLLINDYNIVNNGNNVNQYLEIIELLQAEELIDQIGVQAHAFSTGVSENLIESNLNTLAATGLPIFVTELDIDGPTDQIQLNEYQRIFPVLWAHPAVKGITLWGFRPGMWRTEFGAFLVEEDGITERPALEWLRSYVENTTLVGTNSQNLDGQLSIFPNPAKSGEIKVIGVQEITRIELFDCLGRKIWEPTTENNTFSISEKIDPGIYIIKLHGKKRSFTKKLMISN